MIRTRHTLAIGILGALAATGALLAAGYHFGLAQVLGARAASASSLTGLAPADSDLVLYADLAALRASPLLQPLQSIASNTQQDAEYTAFVRASGFDYDRDLDRLVLVSRKQAADGPRQVIVVGEGRFDRDRIRSYALANGTLEHRGSKEIFLVKADTPGKIIALTFLGANRIAISDSGNLDAILSPPDAAPDAMLASRVARVAGAPLFAVWRTPNLPQNFAPGGIQSQQLSDLIRSVRWVGVTVQPMTDRLHLNIEGECETSDQAATVAGILTTLRLFADGMLSSQGTKNKMDPQMLSLLHQFLDSEAISHNDRWASLSLDVTQDLLQYAAQHAKQAPTPATPSAPPAPVGNSAPPAAAPPPPPAPQR
ncbi:MAG: hypothetical protein ACLP1Y_05140 [Candidatus Acidiferrales bacterium]